MSKRLGSYTHEYSERDLALYALGLGCGVQDLRYVYECHNDFAALPTFAVIPAHPVAMFVPLEGYIPRYDRVRGHDAWCTHGLGWTFTAVALSEQGSCIRDALNQCNAAVLSLLLTSFSPQCCQLCRARACLQASSASGITQVRAAARLEGRTLHHGHDMTNSSHSQSTTTCVSSASRTVLWRRARRCMASSTLRSKPLCHQQLLW
jgi:hypothetical protein